MGTDRKSKVLMAAQHAGINAFQKAIEELRAALGPEMQAHEAYNAVFCILLNFAGRSITCMQDIAIDRSLDELVDMLSSNLKFSFKLNDTKLH